MKAKWQSHRRGRIGIYTRNIPPPYAHAVRNILSAARRCLSLQFKLPTPGNLDVIIFRNKNSTPRLWTNGKDCIYLAISKLRDLRAPNKSGIHHVYGFCHELAHIAMYRRIRNVFSLPPGWGEGWAHYAASTALIPYVWKKLGEGAWPDPYPYIKTEGTERLLRQISMAKHTRDQSVRAAAKLYEIECIMGREKIGRLLLYSEARALTGEQFIPLIEKILIGRKRARSRRGRKHSS